MNIKKTGALSYRSFLFYNQNVYIVLMFKMLMVVLLLLYGAQLKAQALPDSAIKAIAERDASTFKLKQRDYRRFIKARTDSLSDRFKPNMKYVSDTPLLADSVYNSAFRSAAYKKTVNRFRAHRHGAGYLGAMAAAVIAIAALGGVSMLVRKIF